MSTTKYKGYEIKIEQDQDPISPRDHDGKMCVLALFHNRYSLGDAPENIRSKDYSGWEAMKNGILKKEKDVVAIEPVYMYDHSGITIATTPFSCPWDSGQIGFAYVTKRSIRENYAVKRVTKALIVKAAAELESEVKDYDAFLRGDYCGYTIVRHGKFEEKNGRPTCCNCGDTLSAMLGDNEIPDECECESHVDSCWGFESEETALTEAKSYIDATCKRLEEKEVENVAIPA